LKQRAINWLRRHGRYLPHSRRSIWLHGDDIATFSAAEALIMQIRRRWPQYRIVHTAPDRITVNWISARLRDDAVLPLPENTPAMNRFIHALSPQVLIVLNHATIKPELTQIISLNVKIIVNNPTDPDWLLTCLAAEQKPGPQSVRKELGIADDAKVIAVSHPSPVEIKWWVHVIRKLKQDHSSLILLLETNCGSGIGQTLKREGLRVASRSRNQSCARSDVLLMDVPSEFPGMASIASAAVIGGTFSGQKAIASPVWFAAMDVPVIAGTWLHERDQIILTFRETGGLLTADAETIDSLLHRIVTGEQDTLEIRQKAHSLVLEAEITATRALEQLASSIPPPPPENAHQQGWRIKTRLDRFADTRAGVMVAQARSGKRIEDWDQLRRRLKNPIHIMCLGNGPSSEDTQLSSIHYDALFRVNWRWIQRGYLARPDIVFVGDPKTVHHISDPIMAFGTMDWEQTMLLRHLLSGRLRSPEFFTLERMPGMHHHKNWWARPSNGAIMIAAAVALVPKRITIAGIDLFQHPDGRYPGDVRSTNDYAQVHHRNVDLEVIQAALREFKGEVRVIGDILNQAIKVP